jgi:CubicO group peptidase (beta-lactamase class C family)
MAKLYGCLASGGELDGVRLLSSRSIELARRPLSYDTEPYIGEPMSFGIGYELQTGVEPFGPVSVAFGHRGAGGSVHGAWPQLKAGFSYVTNGLRESKASDPRSAALLGALHEAVAGSGG